MKNILRTSNFGFTRWGIALIAAGWMGASSAKAQNVYWDFATANPTSGVPSGISVGAVSQGNNNGTTTMLGTTSASSGYTGASGTSNAGAAARTGVLSTASSGSAYFEFTITPNSGFSFTITAISFGSRETSTGPKSYSLRSSVDSYASDLTTGTLGANSTWTLKSNTGLSINRSLATTYRIYGYAGSGSASVNTANWRIDDLTVAVTATGAETTPAAPVVASASAITTSGFTANWAASSGATKYFLDVATDSGFTAFVTGYQNKDVGNVTSSAVTSLNAGTTYYYRVRANNSAGTSASSGAQTALTTAAGTPSVTVSPTSATGLTNYVGQVSAPTNYTVTGTNLVSNLVVTASTNAIEVSTNSSTGFTNSFSLAPSVDGTLSNTVYVRISASAPVGAVNATVSNVSGVASNNFTVSGTVTQPALTLVLSPTTVQESAGAGASTGTVGIPFSLTNDLTVSLVSSNTAAATVPSIVTITNGQTNATFAIAAVANTNSYVDATAVIAASQANYISASATLTVGNVDVRVPTVVVNKFENTSVDVIELLVVGNGTPGSTVDMRGMLIKDHSSDNANDSGGKYVFSSDPIWEAVPAGTLVVLTLDDTATDANVDGFVVRVGLKNTTYFTKSGTTNFDLATKDMVMIKQAGSLEAGSVGMIHALANGSPTATQTAGAGSPKLVSNVGNAGVIYASNPNSTIADYNGSSVALGAAGTIPFGTANNPANAAFIASLRGTKDISISIAADASIVNENAEVQADKITVALSVAATTDLTVNLSATPAGIVSLPASVTIPAGSSAATVSFTPINDNTSAGNRTVTIAGSADTWSSANSTVTVVDVQYTNPSVVINEVVNQTSGDVVELLVIQNNLNMAGMILKDFSGDMGGDVGGSYTFTSNSLWQSVKAGTLIVLTRDATATEDTDASDGLVTVKLTNTTYFTAGGSFDISAIDMVMIKAAGAESSGITGAIHTFGNGAAGSLFRQANGAKLLFTAGGAGGGADNATSAIVDYNGIGVTGGTATLGAANNANNQTFVTALRASSNSAPTDITLSANTIAENNAVNAEVGTLSTTDSDVGDSSIYTLVSGTGDADNASFGISGSSLRASVAFNFEDKSSYSIRVRTTDSANNTYEKVFTVTVTDVVEQTAQEAYLASFGLSGANLLGTADPDGDGMNNNAEFAFGTSPVDGSSLAVTQTSVTGGIKITYLQRNGVTYTVKSATDLATGFTGTVTPSRTSLQPTVLPLGYEQYEATLTGGDRGFIQVEATVP